MNRRSYASRTKTEHVAFKMGIACVSQIVGAFDGRKCSEDFADCDAEHKGKMSDLANVRFAPGADIPSTSAFDPTRTYGEADSTRGSGAETFGPPGP
jgi:hypothetical protein